MQPIKEKEVKNWLTALFVVALVGFIIYDSYKNSLLRTRGVCSIGVVVHIERGARSSRIMTYMFRYKGEEYRNDQLVPASTSSTIVGRTYYVKIDPLNPSNSKLLLEQESYLTISDVPSAGWQKCP